MKLKTQNLTFQTPVPLKYLVFLYNAEENTQATLNPREPCVHEEYEPQCRADRGRVNAPGISLGITGSAPTVVCFSPQIRKHGFTHSAESVVSFL